MIRNEVHDRFDLGVSAHETLEVALVQGHLISFMPILFRLNYN